MFRSQGFDSTAMGGPDDPPNPSSMPLVEGGNPAWNDVLQHVPEDKRNEVVPKLQEWDKNFQQVQESTAPWKEFIDGGVDPETAQLALNVLTTIENNPQAAYETIGKHLGISTEQVEEIAQEIDDGQVEAPPGISQEQFDTLKRQSDAMAQILVANKQQDEISAQEKQLDTELSTLKKEKGDFPEKEIIYRMMSDNMSAKEAYDDYYKFEEDLIKSRRQAPRVLSGGGSIPQPAIDPTKLDDKGTKNLVVQMLEAAKSQGD